MQAGRGIVVVLGTGGTIAGLADTADDPHSYRAAALPVAALVDSASGDFAMGLESEEVARIDSKDMDFAIWRALVERIDFHAARAEVLGIVVTHGTDTLEETAWFLQRVVAPVKPVVLTGAMRPANANDADGPRNLGAAIRIASDAAPARRGVVVAMAGRVHLARDVRKVHPAIVDAFTSGDAADASIDIDARPEATSRALRLTDLPVDAARWPRVAIVASGAGTNGDEVRAFVDTGFEGIVIAATGNGTLHRRLDEALTLARAKGVALLRSTRCIGGSLERPSEPPERVAQGIEATGLTPAKARVELIVRLLEARAGRRR